MSGFTSGMRSSLTNEWTTPRWLFDELDDEFGFDLDVASTDENALCERHFTADIDGLTQSWDDCNVWCNPPYGREIGKWVQKAAETRGNGVTVLLVPARTDTKWWHSWIAGKASEIRFVKGRLKFGDSGNSAPFPSAIVVYDRRPKKWWTTMYGVERMTMLLNCRCPFPGNTFCDTDCMLSLAHVESSTVTREREETNNKGISCALAVLASHVASDNHCGGNWLVKAVTYGGDDDERD